LSESNDDAATSATRPVSERDSSLPPTVSESLLHLAFESAPVGIAVIEADDGRLGRVLAANQEVGRLLGYDPDAVVGARLESVLDSISAAATTTLEPLVPGAVEHHHFEECLRRDDGSLAFLSIDATLVQGAEEPHALAVVAIRNATDVHDLAARFAFVADHDLLTALLNRRGFETRLVQTLAAAARYREPGAVALLDLDRLASVNSSDGHTAGDGLLQAVAEVLRKRLRTTDLVARVGGDEFALMIGHVDPDAAVHTVQSLLEQLAARIATLSGEASRVTVSAGIAPFSADRLVTAAELLEAADAALVEAKRSGGGRALLAPDPA
jgi:diguanylate cyclase (GGDEF)-like protein/PAS domain S-box-containing protein